MQLGTRKILNRGFTALGLFSIAAVSLMLIVLLAPIVARGVGAFVFRGTVEYRRMMLDQFGRGDPAAIKAELAEAASARQFVYDHLKNFRAELRKMPAQRRRELKDKLEELEQPLAALLGPAPGAPEPAVAHERYGQTRWDRAEVKLHEVLYAQAWDYSDPSKPGRAVAVPRAEQFQGTALADMFPYLEQHLADMLHPRWTFYGRFLTDQSVDAHFFGGIWPELLGTLYLTIGAILFAVPMGIIAAIYLVEYAGEHWYVGVLRSCISTLAGVPSIVFGLFGLAFFINTLHVSPSKSVLAGSLTLAVLVLPLIIRAAEEALRAVPRTYKEAALSVGATRWHTVVTVVLPAALPGILTGIILSMGRAAGETAPIMFTAAVSAGQPVKLWEVLTRDTPALPWNIYSLATEHNQADEIRHVQYGMVLVLIVLVLLLNGAAFVLRARVARKLAG